MRLTFILANTLRTEIAITHENQGRPYSRRSVTIHLTENQLSAIRPQFVGYLNGVDRYEETLDVFIEEFPDPARSGGTSNDT